MNNKKILSKDCQTMTVKEVKEYLGTGTAVTYNLFNSKGFPSIRIGRQLLVRREAFLEWLHREETREGDDATWQDEPMEKAAL